MQPRVGVGVLLVRGGRVLLGLRNPDAEKADSALHGEGTWTAPGGKLDFGESIDECARREVLEETGVKINEVKIVSVSETIMSDTHFITIGMLANGFEGEPKVMEQDIIEWRWWQLDNLPQPIFIATKNILDNYLAGRIRADEKHGKAK